MKTVSNQHDAAQTTDFFAGCGKGPGMAAKASMVNRTHRVVRDRARALNASRSRVRGLILPMLLSFALMLMVLFAVWSVLDGYDLASELPATSNHYILILLWFVPVSGALVAMIWPRRGRGQADTETLR